MGKERNYTFDLKLKLVLEVVEGHGSLRTVSQNAGINRRTLTRWGNFYNTHDEEALRWKKRLGRSMEEKTDLALLYRGINLSLRQEARCSDKMYTTQSGLIPEVTMQLISCNTTLKDYPEDYPIELPKSHK